MYLKTAPFWLRAFYPKQLIWKIKTDKPVVYLTFDDGPIPEVTPKALEILAKYNVKATFFCVGDNIVKHPDIFTCVKDNGHAIGNHTFHHIKGWETDLGTYLHEVNECQKYTQSNLFRPPHGQITRKQARTLAKKYNIIMWSVLTADYDKNISPSECLQTAISNLKPGAIVVFHDSLKAQQNMKYALPLFIEYCLKKGYRFESLPRHRRGLIS